MDTSHPLGSWLQLVQRLIEEQFADILDEHGVTRRQWQLLTVLARQPATVEQLDAAIAPLPTDPAVESSAEHLTELIESGWVDATAGGYDITDRGRTAFDRLTEVIVEHRAAMVEGLSEGELEQARVVLERMSRNLGYAG